MISQLSFEALLLLYCCLTGFVAAGLLGSFYQLVTSKPPQFKLEFSGLTSAFTTVCMVFFAGPFILMRNALRGRRIEGRPLGWLAASTCIAVMWSSLSGMFFLQLALSAA